MNSRLRVKNTTFIYNTVAHLAASIHQSVQYVTMLLIKDNLVLRGGQTIGLKFYCLHAVTISGTRKRLRRAATP